MSGYAKCSFRPNQITWTEEFRWCRCSVISNCLYEIPEPTTTSIRFRDLIDRDIMNNVWPITPPTAELFIADVFPKYHLWNSFRAHLLLENVIVSYEPIYAFSMISAVIYSRSTSAFRKIPSIATISLIEIIKERAKLTTSTSDEVLLRDPYREGSTQRRIFTVRRFLHFRRRTEQR